jgi:fumarate hydratase subunit alpha
MDMNIVSKVSDALVRAGTTFSKDKIDAYRRAISRETEPKSKWVLEMILESALLSQRNKIPLCDDTGVPHLFIEIGKKRKLDGSLIEAIQLGVSEGLRRLPGRPMAVLGNDLQKLDQSCGLFEDPGAVVPSPIIVKTIDEDVIRLHILMQGGGPEIRSKTYRVYHKHNKDTIKDEIVSWAIEGAMQLGCTPCTLVVGIGRSHFEAASMTMEAQVYGNHNIQSDLEKEITDKINQSQIGALGLQGDTTVLATFLKVGPQRASGVRIVCVRPCCCYEPRIANVDL